jgi:hypothetical protein
MVMEELSSADAAGASELLATWRRILRAHARAARARGPVRKV